MCATIGFDSAHTRGEFLRGMTDALEASGRHEARLLTEELAAFVFDVPRLHLPLEAIREVTPTQRAALRDGLQRLQSGEPVQYITGRAGFMGLDFRVDSRALIPRPETEVLVEEVLGCKTLWRRGHPRIVDVGTGSGCIVITLATLRSAGVYFAIDRSQPALVLARENAALHGVSGAVTFDEGDLLGSWNYGPIDAIVANLPYIASGAFNGLTDTVKDFEPDEALRGGATGLSVISQLVDQAPGRLRSGGWLFLETGDDQGETVIERMRQTGFVHLGKQQDLAGRYRIVSGQWQDE